MSKAAQANTPSAMAAQVQQTRRAARELARLSTDQRNQILMAAADRLEARAAEILKANLEDCASLERDAAAGTASTALLKRLKTSPSGIRDMAGQIRDVAGLEDPLGRELAITERDDGRRLCGLVQTPLLGDGVCLSASFPRSSPETLSI